MNMVSSYSHSNNLYSSYTNIIEFELKNSKYCHVTVSEKNNTKKKLLHTKRAVGRFSGVTLQRSYNRIIANKGRWVTRNAHCIGIENGNRFTHSRGK